MTDGILCTIFPFLNDLKFASGLCSDLEGQGEGAFGAIQSLIALVASLVFVGIIGIAIFIIIKAALKYIRSEGDEAKVEEATKAIKNVFIGIAALIIGIIGLVIILAIFSSGSGSPLSPGGENPGLPTNPDLVIPE